MLICTPIGNIRRDDRALVDEFVQITFADRTIQLTYPRVYENVKLRFLPVPFLGSVSTRVNRTTATRWVRLFRWRSKGGGGGGNQIYSIVVTVIRARQRSGRKRHTHVLFAPPYPTHTHTDDKEIVYLNEPSCNRVISRVALLKTRRCCS